MKTLATLLATLLLATMAVAGPADDKSAKELLDRVDDLWRGDSSKGKMSMKVVTEHYTREMTIEQWTKGKEQSLMRILAPRKEKGTATLKSGDNIWNYLPKVKRVIKVPSSMMGGSWMGSHFTNDDLVKESRMAEDYTFEISFRGERDGQKLIEVTLMPKDDAAVVWGKVVVTVLDADLMPQAILYYDEDLELARTMTFEEVKTFDGRKLPARMKMVPQDKPKEYTEFVVHDISFDVKLKDKVFSLRNLQK